MGNNCIRQADITVVPHFDTNGGLAESICDIINGHLEKINNSFRTPFGTPLRTPFGAPFRPPLTADVPKLLVFRPSGRAGDEFEEHVSPHLIKEPGVKWYLIIASSPKPAGLFSISEGYIEKIQDLKTKVVINGGRLVSKSEFYHNFNSENLKELAEDIYKNYNNVRVKCR